MTEDLDIRLFQARYDNHLGQPLDIDGKLGSQSLWANGIALLPMYRRQAIQTCQRLARIGIEEAQGNNRHPFIDVVLEKCGVPLGSAWCAAAASFALGENKDNWQAGAQALGKSYPDVKVPIPGDLGWYPTGRWQGHVFIVGAVDLEAQQVMTYEGNRRNAYRVIRRPMKALRFSRTFPDIHGGPVPIPKGLRLVYNRSQGTR